MIALIVTALIAAAIGFWLGYEFAIAPLDPGIDAFEREAGLIVCTTDKPVRKGEPYYIRRKFTDLSEEERSQLSADLDRLEST